MFAFYFSHSETLHVYAREIKAFFCKDESKMSPRTVYSCGFCNRKQLPSHSQKQQQQRHFDNDIRKNKNMNKLIKAAPSETTAHITTTAISPPRKNIPKQIKQIIFICVFDIVFAIKCVCSWLLFIFLLAVCYLFFKVFQTTLISVVSFWLSYSS